MVPPQKTGSSHLNSDTAFERHRSRIPINDLNTVHALKKHLIQFLGLKELTIKYGLGDFDIKLYRMAPKPSGKSDNFAITTDDQWQLELPSQGHPTTIFVKHLFGRRFEV